MKKILIVSLLLITTMLSAQKPVELLLWPNGAPNSNALTGEQKELDGGRVTNIVTPSITVYPSHQPNGAAVIMCPGGAYTLLAMNHEGHDMASWFNARGITYVVLKYRMPNGHHEVPLSDAEQAIRLVRLHAGNWGVDPHRVGIMGASAGGHLAASLASLYSSDETRPDFQILLYPVISMVKGIGHGGSRQNLLGAHPSEELEQRYSLEKQVTARSPQAFILLSSDDTSVLPINGVSYYLALLQQKVQATLHAYPTGGHGWGFLDSFTYKPQWTGELEKWLQINITK